MVPDRNPKFFTKIEEDPSILTHFEEGSKVIKNKGDLKAVELDMYAGDKARQTNKVIDDNGDYVLNTERKSFDDFGNSSKKMSIGQQGQIKDANGNVLSTDLTKKQGGLMYVIDEKGNIFMGGRQGADMCHPTLIGGANPNVKCAGMIHFYQGKIVSISHNSGHFKPTKESVFEAISIFQKKVPNSFDPRFDPKGLDLDL
jgi:hypothetical protein